jgi:hypothetical protein
MKKIISIVVITLAVSVLSSSQTTNGTQTVCKGGAIPEGYTIIGESESPNCPNKAWVIKQRGTPKLTMQEPLRNTAAPPPEDRTGAASSSSAPANDSAVEFAKRAFQLLSEGDLAVEEMIDWEHLKLNGKEFGRALGQMATASGKDLSAVRKEMILAFGNQYKSAGEGPLTRWRVQSQSEDGVTVAANTAKGLVILFTVSEREGRSIITALDESK